MNTKKCSACGIFKDINDFYISKNIKYKSRCKNCILKNMKENYCKKRGGIVKNVQKTKDVLLKGSRICYTCKNELDLSLFRKLKTKNGFIFYNSCIPCSNKNCSNYAKNNREKRNKRLKKYRKNNPEKMKIIDRRRSLKHNYNLSIDDYNNMVSQQNGKCYICGAEKKLAVDHNHETGKVRKLLCTRCNVFLGQIEKNDGELDKFILYLKSHQ